MKRDNKYLSVGGVDKSKHTTSIVMTKNCNYCDPEVEKQSRLDGIEQIDQDSASALVARLREITENHSYAMFRGQTHDWCLRPTAHRSDTTGSDIDKFVNEQLHTYPTYIDLMWKNESISSFTRRYALALRYYFEKELVYKFAQLAAITRLLTVEPSVSPPSIIDILLYLTSVEIPWRHDKSYSEIHAQHHGVPTKMLDFTRDFWVAIWHTAHREPDDDEKAIVIWAIAGDIPFDVIDTTHAPDYFLREQESVLFWNSCADYEFYVKGKYNPFDIRLKKRGNGNVFKLRLSSREISGLRAELELRGLSLYSMGAPMFLSVEEAQAETYMRRCQFNAELKETLKSELDITNVSNVEKWKQLRPRATIDTTTWEQKVVSSPVR